MDAEFSSRFEAAIAKIKQVVGEKQIILKGEAFEERAGDTSPKVQRPAGFVFPASVEEVQAIVKVANEFKISLWPVSKGKNWGYGAATAVHAGALIVVLERMNRILEVNEELAYTIIEPGVTYGQLNTYLKENHPHLWTDTTDSTPEGSVLGNALERGLGETPYGDHFANLCGLEAVMPTGERVCTGASPSTGAKTWTTHKWGTGPYLEGLFSQSNFGIVTKAGFWLMPAPESFSSMLFEVHDEEHVVPALNALRRLALKGVIRSNIHAGNNNAILMILHSYYRDYSKKSAPLTKDEQDHLCNRFGVALWTFNCGLYGAPQEIRAWKSLIKRELSAHGTILFMTDPKMAIAQKMMTWLSTHQTSFIGAVGAKLFRKVFGKSLEYAQMGPYQHNLLKGIPTEYFLRYAYCKSANAAPAQGLNPARDHCGEMWHAPAIPFTGEHFKIVRDACRPWYEHYRMDFCMTLLLINPRALVTLMGIFFVKEDPEETARANALHKKLCEVTLALGYQPYRAGVASMPGLLDSAPDYKELAHRLKLALDPNLILAPGRYGVAPFHP